MEWEVPDNRVPGPYATSEDLEMRDRQFAATQQHLLKAADALAEAAQVDFESGTPLVTISRALRKASEAFRRAGSTELKPKGKLPS
jgi:hypothetical protein